jgi:hypothetical protein
MSSMRFVLIIDVFESLAVNTNGDFPAFIFCWSPYFVYDLLFVYGQIPDPNSERVSAMNTFIQSLAPLNSAVNPFIFLLFNFNNGDFLSGKRF